MFLEVACRQACPLDKPDGFVCQFDDVPLRSHGPPRCRIDYLAQLLFGSDVADLLLVLLGEEFRSQVEYAFANVPALALVHALVHEIHEPLLQLPVVAYAFDQGVGALFENGRRVELDGIVKLDAQFDYEGPQYALEECVYREDGEARIVVQYVCPCGLGPLADCLPVEVQVAAQRSHIPALFAGCQFVDLPQDSRLHLFGSLVREGYGKYVAI